MKSFIHNNSFINLTNHSKRNMDKGTSTFDKIVISVRLSSEHVISLSQGSGTQGFDHIIAKHPEIFKNLTEEAQIQKLTQMCSPTNAYAWISNIDKQPVAILFKGTGKSLVQLIIAHNKLGTYKVITCFKKEEIRIRKALTGNANKFPEKYAQIAQVYQLQEADLNQEEQQQVKKLLLGLKQWTVSRGIALHKFKD